MLRVPGHVGERQYRDRGLVGSGGGSLALGVSIGIGPAISPVPVPPANVFEKPLRLGLRLEPQLGVQNLAASLVLLDRQAAVTGGGVEPHQGAMGGFIERVQR